jgi:hypothetical protein
LVVQGVPVLACRARGRTIHDCALRRTPTSAIASRRRNLAATLADARLATVRARESRSSTIDSLEIVRRRRFVRVALRARQRRGVCGGTSQDYPKYSSYREPSQNGSVRPRRTRRLRRPQQRTTRHAQCSLVGSTTRPTPLTP